MLNPAILRRRRSRGNPFAAYAAGGINPSSVADFSNGTYLGTVSALSDFAAPRTSASTAVDEDGNRKWLPHFFGYSTNILEDWSTTGCTKSSWAEETEYGGSVITASAGTSAVYTHISSLLPVNGVIRARFKVEANTHDIVQIHRNASAAIVVNFDLSNGTKNEVQASGLLDATIVADGDGWILTVEYVATTSTHYPIIGMVKTLSSARREASLWAGTEAIKVAQPRCYRIDLGGMFDDSITGTDFVENATTGAPVYHTTDRACVYSDGAWQNAGVSVEPAITNLFTSPLDLSTQDVTVTAVPHTVHFVGTGTITFSGAYSGSLVGAGSGEEDRVSTTFTPSAGTLTCTVSGEVNVAQIEALPYPTSFVDGSRAANSLSIANFGGASYSTEFSLVLWGHLTYRDTGAADIATMLRLYTDANNYLTYSLDGTTGTGDVVFTQVESGTVDTAQITSAYSEGDDVAFKLSSRHTASALQGAADGVASAENDTVSALADFTSTTIELGYDGPPMYIGRLLIFTE